MSLSPPLPSKACKHVPRFNQRRGIFSKRSLEPEQLWQMITRLLFYHGSICHTAKNTSKMPQNVLVLVTPRAAPPWRHRVSHAVLPSVGPGGCLSSFVAVLVVIVLYLWLLLYTESRSPPEACGFC